MMPQLSNRVGTFTDSVIRRMTRINDAYGAINLSQGFPDFDPPQEIMDALAKAAYKGSHQYSVTYGAPNFRQALAKKYGKTINREIDPDKEIAVTCGGTEAMCKLSDPASFCKRKRNFGRSIEEIREIDRIIKINGSV